MNASVSTFLGELYTACCSPTDATLVATGGGDDRGFMWRIGQGDFAFELQGICQSADSVPLFQFSSILICLPALFICICLHQIIIDGYLIFLY